MKAIVVYESHWGHTAAVARAIAEGIGPEAQAMSTAEATGPAIEGVDLIVAGAPLMGFGLPTEQMLANVRTDRKAPTPPDVSHPLMRSWLAALPAGQGRSAAFETRLRWSPGGSAPAILRELERLGYRAVAKPQRFVVKGTYGPLREGELERARQWGAELARATG